MTSIRPFSDRFVVRGLVAETSEVHHVKKGAIVYLGWTHEGGGWFQWRDDLRAAYPFADRTEAESAARGAPGPWFYKPDPATIEVLEATYTPPQDADIRLK